MQQLVALVKAKLDPANGAFASLRGICFGSLSLELILGNWVLVEPNRLNPYTGDLRSVCEEADVKLHDENETIEGMSQDASWCISCKRCWEPALDSEPVVLVE